MVTGSHVVSGPDQIKTQVLNLRPMIPIKDFVWFTINRMAI